jgi:aminopeptidase N
MLKKYAETFQYKIIETNDVVQFFSQESGLNLTPFFDEYLKHKDLPVLEYKIKGDTLSYRWKANESLFKMPFEYSSSGTTIRLDATTTWQEGSIKVGDASKFEIGSAKFLLKSKKVE